MYKKFFNYKQTGMNILRHCEVRSNPESFAPGLFRKLAMTGGIFVIARYEAIRWYSGLLHSFAMTILIIALETNTPDSGKLSFRHRYRSSGLIVFGGWDAGNDKA